MLTADCPLAAGRVPAPMRIQCPVSSSATEYTGACCERDPFCAQHWSDVDTTFYLVRTIAGQPSAAAVHADGVSVRDSWHLGSLQGYSCVPLRYLLQLQVAEEGSESSEASSPLEPPSEGRCTTPLSTTTSPEGVNNEFVALLSCDSPSYGSVISSRGGLPSGDGVPPDALACKRSVGDIV